jgi:hypothetical protein
MDEVVEFGDSECVLAATDAAIAAARDQLTAMDQGAVMALRVLAQKIDNMLDDAPGVAEDGTLIEERKRAMLDNVTLPTYLKYCDALGLTPAGRKALVGGAKPGRPRSKLAGVQGEVRSLTGRAS